MNYLSIDTEYSSFYSPERSKSGDLLQLSIVPVINGIEQKPFNEYCRPLGKIWSHHAEKVHKISKKKAMGFQHPNELGDKLKEFVSQYDCLMQPLGHNCKGDKNYLERLVYDCKMAAEWYPKVRDKWKDTHTIAKKLKNMIPTKDMKLQTLCKYFGIEIKAHDAVSDAQATSKLYQKLDAMIAAKEGRQSGVGGESELQKRKKYLDMKYVSFGGDGTVFLTEFCTGDREALRIVLGELWAKYGES